MSRSALRDPQDPKERPGPLALRERPGPLALRERPALKVQKATPEIQDRKDLRGRRAPPEHLTKQPPPLRLEL